MLVYIKESHVKEILLEPNQLKFPAHIKKKFDEECNREELERKHKLEEKQFVNVEIASIESFKNYIQTPFFGLFDFSSNSKLCYSFRIKKDTSIFDFKKIISDHFNIPIDGQRIWRWIERTNDTFRISKPLTEQEDDKSKFF